MSISLLNRRVVFLTLAAEIVSSVAVGSEDSEFVVGVVLNIESALEAVDIGIHILRFFDRGVVINRANPNIAQRLVIISDVVNSASRAIGLVVGNFIANVGNHASCLFNCGFVQSDVSDDFGCDVDFAASARIIRIIIIVHRKRPSPGIAAQIGVNYIIEIRAAVNPKQLERRSRAARIIERFGEENLAHVADILVAGRMND